MRCAAITRAGERCRLEATSGSYCWSHAPENAQARKRRARRGGKAGGNGRGGSGEIVAIKTHLWKLVEDVHAAEIDRAAAIACGQILNTLLRAIATEVKLREQQELTERLEEIESRVQSKWGA